MTPAKSAFSERAAHWLTSQLGHYDVLRAYRSDSKRTGVWKIRSDEGVFFFKINRRRNRWGSEVFAYRNWSEAFAPYLPELRAVFDCPDNPGLLLTAVPGSPLREAGLTGSDSARAFARAGRLLRRLHDFAVGEFFGCMDEEGRPIDWSGQPLSASRRTDLVLQMREFLTAQLERGKAIGCLASDEQEAITWAIDAADCYASEVPVPTSEDFTPGNWLVDDKGDLVAVIDLENMHWGDRMNPFARLVLEYFPKNPEGEQAFYKGYGSCPPKEHIDQARIAYIMYAASYTIAGVESNDPGSSERGRRAFLRSRG